MESLEEFDIFPKVDQSFKKSTSQGGLVTILVAILLSGMVISSYLDWKVFHKYQYVIDLDVVGTYKFNIDITLPMKCEHLDVNLLDSSKTMKSLNSELSFQTVEFQKAQQDLVQKKILQYSLNIRNLIKDASHHKNNGLPNWLLGLSKMFNSPLGKGIEGCNIKGQTDLQKVTGNIHITAKGHGYSGIHVDHEHINFTHAINMLQFGHYYPGLVNPLDGIYQDTDNFFTVFDYFISVVPTIYVDLYGNNIHTCQYAVTEFKKNSKSGGSLPGIYFQFDFEAVSIKIMEESQGIISFIIRLGGILSGVWMISGVLHQIVYFFLSKFLITEDRPFSPTLLYNTVIDPKTTTD